MTNGETEIPQEVVEQQVPQDEPTPKPKQARKAKAKAKKQEDEPQEQITHKTGTLLTVDTGDKSFHDLYVLPDTEADPYWDNKLKNAVPDGVVDGLFDLGWDQSSVARGVRQANGVIKITHGKTRWRAIPKVNTLLKRADLPPLTAYVYVEDERPDDEAQMIHGMEMNAQLNHGTQFIDPLTKAEDILRLYSAGIDERRLAKRFSCTVNDVHGYLLLTDETKCPPVVQELLRAGKLSFTAALELARRAEKMSTAELAASAEQMAKISNGGLRVTTNDVKKAAGVNANKPATLRERKQFLLDVQSAKFEGKMGDAVKWALVIATELGLGTRTLEQTWSAAAKISKGQTIKVDFKQYQSAMDRQDKPVKGQ